MNDNTTYVSKYFTIKVNLGFYLTVHCEVYNLNLHLYFQHPNVILIY